MLTQFLHCLDSVLKHDQDDLDGMPDSGNMAEGPQTRMQEGLVNRDEGGGSSSVFPSPVPPENNDPKTICLMLHEIQCAQQKILRQQDFLFQEFKNLACLQKGTQERVELTCERVRDLQSQFKEQSKAV